MRRKLIAGNMKMNGLGSSVAELDQMLAGLLDHIDVSIHPPLTLLSLYAAHARGRLIVGAQDVWPGVFGARTGEVSATMLRDAGARAVIVGHSERRAHQGETDALVRLKAEAALAAGLLTILCVGETLAEREGGGAHAAIAAQLAGSLPEATAGPGANERAGELVIGYEPVWAVGTGLTPTAPQIADMHAAIRAVVGRETRILYGGSVVPANAAALLGVPGVDGALVGGASLKAADFLAIVNAGH